MAQRFYLPRQQILTDLGAVGAGWKLESFSTGTSTPLATFSDTALTVANANPIIADSAGRLPDIFVDDLKLYKFVLSDDTDVVKWTADPSDPKVFNLNDFDPRPTSFWGTTAGTSSAYTLAADPTLSTYSSTDTFFAAIHTANVGSPTMKVDALTALNLKKYDGTGTKLALEANDLVVQTYEFRNDGTDIIVLNPERTNLLLNNKSELTISSGAITVTNSWHFVDTEADAASDILTDITAEQGQVFFLRLQDSTRNVTITHGGPIRLANNKDFDFQSSINTYIGFLCVDGTNTCVEISRNRGNATLSLYNTSIYGTNSYKRKLINVAGAFDEEITQQGLEVSIAGNTTVTVNLPITFPNAIDHGMVSVEGVSVAITDEPLIQLFSTSQIKISNGHTGAISVFWEVTGH